MGDSRSRYYDDLEDYELFCKELSVKTEDDFYKHQDRLLKEMGYRSLYEYYDAERKANERNNKIDKIIKS